MAIHYPQSTRSSSTPLAAASSRLMCMCTRMKNLRFWASAPFRACLLLLPIGRGNLRGYAGVPAVISSLEGSTALSFAPRGAMFTTAPPRPAPPN